MEIYAVLIYVADNVLIYFFLIFPTMSIVISTRSSLLDPCQAARVTTKEQNVKNR